MSYGKEAPIWQFLKKNSENPETSFMSACFAVHGLQCLLLKRHERKVKGGLHESFRENWRIPV
jgi:hypothetical protein